MIVQHLLSLLHFAERHKPLAVYCGATIVVLNGLSAVLRAKFSTRPKDKLRIANGAGL